MENDNKRRALGRGLEELFNNEPLDYGKVEEKILNEATKDSIQNIKLDELRANPYQPRKTFDEDAVKASIMAGLKEIPAIVRDFNDQEMMEIALLENLQRENLTAIEEANAYKKLQENLNITQEELAKRLGKSRSHITNMLGLLSLPNDIQKDVQEKNISMAHARILSKLENKKQQEDLVKKIKKEKISVHELENMTSNEKYERKNKITKSSNTKNEYQFIENELCEKLGTKVRIKKNI